MRIPSDSDFFQHLALGQDFLEKPSFAAYDHWSYTANGERWLRHTFLYGVTLALIHKPLGLTGIWLLQALTLCALAALLWKYRQNHSLRPWESFWLFLLVFCEIYSRFNYRGENFAYLLFFLELLWLSKTLRRNRRLHWSFPLFLVFWQCFQTSAYLGLVPYGFYAFLAAIKSRNVKPLLLYAGTLCLMLFAHPDSYRVHLLISKGLEFHRYLPVHEMLPPVGIIHTYYWIAVTIAGIGVVFHKFRRHDDQTRIWPRGFWFNLRHVEKFFPLLCFGFFFVFSLGVSRAIPFALLCALPFLRRGLLFLFASSWIGRLPLFIAAAVFLAVFFIRVSFSDYSPGKKLYPRFHPEAVADFILREKPPGNLFHPVFPAGYLSWRFQGAPRIFIDFRLDLYVSLIKDLTNARRTVAGFTAFLARHNIHTVIIERAAPFATDNAVFDKWVVVYRDKTHDIRIKPDCAECQQFVRRHKLPAENN